VIPFSYDVSGLELKSKYPKAYEFYNNLFKTAGVPVMSVKLSGNNLEFGITANGEVSDWMLYKGIYALSPRIGTANLKTQSYFIKQA
jgi:hypothetical protein